MAAALGTAMPAGLLAQPRLQSGGTAFTDYASLGSGVDSQSADGVRKAAEQFESLFIDLLLKQMRAATEVLSPDSPFNSQQVKFHQQMLDHQMAIHMAENGGLGMGDLIAQQLSGGVAARRGGGAGTVQLALPQAGAATAAVAGATEQAATEPRLAPPEKLLQNKAMAKLPEAGQEPLAGPAAFVERLLPAAQRVAAAAGLHPLALVAQAALETGWGAHVLKDADGSSNNLFNIKAGSQWQGPVVEQQAVEFVAGRMVHEQAAFRRYDSLEQALEDYAALITGNDRFQQAAAVADDPDRYAEALQDAGYATDPSYAEKLKAVLRSPVLQDAADRVLDAVTGGIGR